MPRNRASTQQFTSTDASSPTQSDQFLTVRAEDDITDWRVVPGSPEHRWFMQRLRGYPVGRTKKYLFQRPQAEERFARAAHYLMNEMCRTVALGRHIVVVPLPAKNFDPRRYATVDGNMLASIVRAMEKHGDIGKAPGTRGGRPLADGGYTATQWALSHDLLAVLDDFVRIDAVANPLIEMRRSWERLSVEDQKAFRAAWRARELRIGRTGDCYDPTYQLVTGPNGKPTRRKTGTKLRMNDSEPATATNADWVERWHEANWYAGAAGRRMAVDEPGVADLMERLSRSNAFTALHGWCDHLGRQEPSAKRMSYRVFRDDSLDTHGRFYYPAQSARKGDLEHYTVDGEATDTGDVVCTHPSMVLAAAGNSIYDAPYNGDIYRFYADRDLQCPEQLQTSIDHASRFGLLVGPRSDALMAADVIRQQYKRGFSVCLNAKDRNAAINALARSDPNDPSAGFVCRPEQLGEPHDAMAKPFWSRDRAVEVVDTILADPIFAPSMCAKAGPQLMRQDARWMEQVRSRLEAAAIPYRDCHDSIMCPISRRAEVDAIMKEEWTALFGIAPAIKWSKLSAQHASTEANTGAGALLAGVAPDGSQRWTDADPQAGRGGVIRWRTASNARLASASAPARACRFRRVGAV